jgi:hypothetical protein
VFAGAGSYASAAAFTDGFAPAIGVSTGLAVVGALAGVWLPDRHPAIQMSAAPAVSSGGAQ